MIQKFPKPWRYSVGEKLQTVLLSIIEETAQSLYARQPLKESYILKVIGSIQSLQLFIRLAFEEDLMDEHHFFSLSNNVLELQRMAAGWLKSVRNN